MILYVIYKGRKRQVLPEIIKIDLSTLDKEVELNKQVKSIIVVDEDEGDNKTATATKLNESNIV